MRTHKIATLLSIGAIVVPFANTMSAPQAPSCTPQWQREPTPEQYGGYVRAQTVSAISERDVRIAGHASAYQGPWSMRWDGRSITEVPTAPLGLMRTIDRVRASSYASPDEGWLLMDFPDRITGGIPNAAHWEDGRWTLTPTAVPDDPIPDGPLALMSVASVAPDDAWAVGTREDDAGWDLGLIERWDGTQWTVVDHPEATHRGSGLHDVVAVSATNVWAVGQASPETGSWTDARPLVMHYDGTAWTTLPTPEIPAESRPAWLKAVSVTDDGHVWAVGTQGVDGATYGRPLVLHYDGSGWQEVPDPGIGDRADLVGVYAAAGDDVWAVANHNDGAPSELLHWDGTSWTAFEWPGPLQDRLSYFATDMDGTGPDDVWVTGLVQRLEGTGGPLVPVSATPQVAHLSCGRGK